MTLDPSRPSGETGSGPQVFVCGPLDDLRSPLVRLLQEAARLGPLTALPWPDEAIRAHQGREPRFPLAERIYFLQAQRYVRRVMPVEDFPGPHALPPEVRSGTWVVDPGSDHPEKRAFCRKNNLAYHALTVQSLEGFPFEPLPPFQRGDQKLVLVTGSFDWLHTGHVRFFEEVAGFGRLVVVVGHDANIKLLKGPGHPLFTQDERLYMVQAVRYVSQVMISTGHGWLDAEPEMERLKPDAYAVNEDGDKPEKRAYCEAHGIEYLVLKRRPKEGLDPRSSTHLRGF